MSGNDRVFGTMADLKVGKYVIIEDEPCRVISVDKSKPGKHGAAKMKVEAVGLFDSGKRGLMKPADADVEIPIIERKRAQVISVSGTSAQLMDLESYDTFEVSIPQEMQGEAESGKEIQYIHTMGRKLLLKLTQGA
ncbi:MAG: translation initiation factor IF-5A [Candidatus Micrarchaeia archaeon]